jgi:hypothetical protein
MKRRRPRYEVLVDGQWLRPIYVNDKHLAEQGWLGYRLAYGRSGVALHGEFRRV